MQKGNDFWMEDWMRRIPRMSLRHKREEFGKWIYRSDNGYLVEWWEISMGPPPKTNNDIAFVSSSILITYPGGCHLPIWLQLQRLYLATSPSS